MQEKGPGSASTPGLATVSHDKASAEEIIEWQPSLRTTLAEVKSDNHHRGLEDGKYEAIWPRLGSLTVVVTDTAHAVGEVPEWEELDMRVDSGASVTVINKDMVKAVTASDARPDIRYEVADGSQIPHLGEKEFNAFSDTGLLRRLNAQVTEVNKALLSVSRIVKAGNTVVFDDSGSYIEHKASDEWMPVEEKGGVYTLNMWIPRDRTSLF